MSKTLAPIVKALREISEWPWYVDTADDTAVINSHDLDIGVYEEKEEENAFFVASSPLWLAQMVVGIVEERAELSYRRQGGKWAFIALTARERREWRTRALHDFNLTKEDYEWLKGKPQDETR